MGITAAWMHVGNGLAGIESAMREVAEALREPRP